MNNNRQEPRSAWWWRRRNEAYRWTLGAYVGFELVQLAVWLAKLAIVAALIVGAAKLINPDQWGPQEQRTQNASEQQDPARSKPPHRPTPDR